MLSHGRYHLAVPVVAQRRVSETQGRVVALDPGIRSFLTWFSEDDAGHIGKGDFGRIQRLCARLDDLLSRASKAGHQRKRNMHRAADRLRLRIRNLVEELHHKAARYLVDNYDVILFPRFESSDMVRRGARRLQRKSVRNLLTFAHYRFRSFLQWKAGQTGKTVLVVNEAYTSKTCSWSGEMLGNPGRSKGGDGQRRRPAGPGHKRRSWDIPAGFGRYPTAQVRSEQVQHAFGQCDKWIDHRADAD